MQVTPVQADLLAGSYAFSSVFRFKDDGTPLTANDVDFGVGGLNQAAGVTVGPDGNFYVSSIATGEILFYDGATGVPLPSPHAGGHDGLFATLINEGNENFPVGGPGPLRFGPDGNLYVADFNGNSIRVFDGTSGEEGAPAGVMDLFGVPGKAGSVAFGPDGAIYAGDFNTASVYRFENGVASYFIPPPTSQPDIYSASSLLFLPNGHLLVSDTVGNKLVEYDENGQNPQVFAEIPPFDNPPNPEAQNPFGSNFPSDLAFDQDGNIVLAVLGYNYVDTGQILRFDLEGNPLGDPPGTPLVDGYSTLSSVAWIKSADAVTGDYDGDGSVGESDYLKWKSDFGKWVAKGGGADGNGDGIVDAADFTVWRDALPPQIANAAGVPEPTSLALLTLVLLPILGTRTRSKRRKQAQSMSAAGVAVHTPLSRRTKL